LPRLGALDRYVTPDELHWVDRSIRFSQALARGEPADTVQAGHPGVTTLWLGSLGLTLQRVFNPAAPTPGQLPEFAPQDADAMRYLAQFLTPMRWPVILVTSFNLVLLFWLLSRVIDRRAAFLAAALVALDPFAVALGGILHVDSLLMTFSLASLAALSVALTATRSTRWLIMSGALAGLAMLSKSPAIVLVPTAGLVIALDAVRKRAAFREVIRSSLIWGLSAAFIFIALYPAMWVAPLKALKSLTDTAEKHSETAHAVNYFFGNSERDPGAAFYPVALAYRSTIVLWPGLIAFGVLIGRGRSDDARRWQRTAWPYWVFALVFTGLITLAAKKLDRYMLPTLEALNVIGAIGLAYVIDRIVRSSKSTSSSFQRLGWAISTALAVIVVMAQFVAVWPLTLRAYNPVLGGYAGAARALPVGGGESGEVAAVLSRSPFASSVIAATDIVGLAPFFNGPLLPTNATGFAQSDYLLFSASDVQLTPDLAHAWTSGLTPVLTATVQGQPFAWLYDNVWLTADRQRAQQLAAADAVIVDEAAPQLSLPAAATTVISTVLSSDQAVSLLQNLAQSHRRVLIYHFAGQPDRNVLELFRALDTYAVNLNQWSSPLSSGGLYELPDPAAFDTPPLPLNGDVVFGDRIQLNDIQAVLAHVQPGQSISFVSQWQATGDDATLSVSLLDAANHVWSTSDTNVPIAEQAGISRQRRFTLPVPPTTPPGEYRVTLNVVDVASGRLLHVRALNDQPSGGTDWPLGTITIDPAQTLIDPATRLPPITLNVDLGGLIRAIGSEQPPAPINSGDPWTLSMEWLALHDQLPTLDVQWNVVAANDSIVYSTTLPLNAYSTDRWRKGDVLQSKYDFRLPTTLPDGRYSLDFQVLDRSTRRPIAPRPTTLTTIQIASRPRTFTAPALPQPSNTRFDQLATLIGAEANRAGDALTITLYWRAQAITSTNYTVFVQLTRPDGQVIQQIDRWQIGGDNPTSTWVVDQIVGDAYAFEAPNNEYQVWVGVYNAADGRRLPAFDAHGQRLPQDRALALTVP
jgi:4-amino-4-deoxy-L-arabinose transferase-like glycosyltransferase